MGNENDTPTKPNQQTMPHPANGREPVPSIAYPYYQYTPSPQYYYQTPVPAQYYYQASPPAQYYYPTPLQIDPQTYYKNYYYATPQQYVSAPVEPTTLNNNQGPSSHNPQSQMPLGTVQRPISLVNGNYSTSVLPNTIPLIQQLPAVLVENNPIQKPPSPIKQSQSLSAPITEIIIPTQNVSATYTPSASSFHKAPLVQLNYIPKPSNARTANSYGPGNLPVVHKTSTQASTSGSRWYDNDSNDHGKPVVVKYL